VYTKRGDELRVGDVVREVAAERPEHVAIRQGARELTYAALDERSSRLAQALRASGAREGSRIAYLDRTAPEVVELLFAAAKLGAVTVPLNWRLSPRELALVLEDACPPVLIAGEAYAGLAAELAAKLANGGGEVIVVGDGYERWLAAHDARDPGRKAASSDVVLQMYTSGTTGVPKGVLTTHRNLAAAAETSPYWAFDSESVSMTPLPMFHIGGIGWAFLGLWNGATTVLVSQFEAEDVLDLFERQRVTNAVLVPTMIQLLTAVPGAAERDYSALRSIAYGASPITTTLLRAALRTFRCPLFGVYGLTESTGGVVHLDPSDHDPDGPRNHLLRSAGRPLPWVELRIADPVTGVELPAGEVGEVWLRAPNVMLGYHKRPAETEAALAPGGWLRTGDGGYVDDEGYLFLTDRIKDMIVSGGENVYPIEVEEVLAQHPDVADVAVVGVPDDRWGELVKAFVVLRPGGPLTGEELVAFARPRLAGYKLPRAVEIVDDLPRTPSGKVLKRALRERDRAGSPAPTG
jgi:acyl-CoA synthetase (AMP-forming)/AMP-acid ligase II